MRRSKGVLRLAWANLDFVFLTAMSAVWKEGVSDRLAARTLVEQSRSAGGTGVGFFLGGAVAWHFEFSDRSARPKEVLSGTGADWVFTDRAKETFVGFTVLIDEPFRLRKSDAANKVYEHFPNDDEQRSDEDVFEILRRKVLMHDEAYLD